MLARPHQEDSTWHAQKYTKLVLLAAEPLRQSMLVGGLQEKIAPVITHRLGFSDFLVIQSHHPPCSLDMFTLRAFLCFPILYFITFLCALFIIAYFEKFITLLLHFVPGLTSIPLMQDFQPCSLGRLEKLPPSQASEIRCYKLH